MTPLLVSDFILKTGTSLSNKVLDGPPAPQVLEAIQFLLKIGRNRTLDAAATAAINIVATSGSCLSPDLFHSQLGGFKNGDIVVRLVKALPFGRTVCAALDKVGLFSFLGDVSERATSERMLYRVIAAASYTFPTNRRGKTISRDVMMAALDWYRTKDGLRFRSEV